MQAVALQQESSEHAAHQSGSLNGLCVSWRSTMCRRGRRCTGGFGTARACGRRAAGGGRARSHLRYGFRIESSAVFARLRSRVLFAALRERGLADEVGKAALIVANVGGRGAVGASAGIVERLLDRFEWSA